MRPLFVDFPDDQATLDVDDTFMFGDALLVAPVLAPGLQSRALYLPQLPGNATWFDFWNRGKRFASGRSAMVNVTLDSIPVFVRMDVDDAKFLPDNVDIYLF